MHMKFVRKCQSLMDLYDVRLFLLAGTLQAQNSHTAAARLQQGAATAAVH
jgi:hypothetical protein